MNCCACTGAPGRQRHRICESAPGAAAAAALARAWVRLDRRLVARILRFFCSDRPISPRVLRVESGVARNQAVLVRRLAVAGVSVDRASTSRSSRPCRCSVALVSRHHQTIGRHGLLGWFALAAWVCVELVGFGSGPREKALDPLESRCGIGDSCGGPPYQGVELVEELALLVESRRRAETGVAGAATERVRSR